MTPETESYTPTELTRQTALSDLRQQPMLMAAAALAVCALVLFWLRRPPSQQTAARHLVRDWRNVDDVDDARNLLSANMPVVLRPALLAALDAAEDQVHAWFRQAERSIRKL